MIEEFLVDKIESLYDDLNKQDLELEKRIEDSENIQNGYATIQANKDYKKNEETLDDREKLILAASMLATASVEALQLKLIKNRKNRIKIRRYLLAEAGGKVRELLYRKGDLTTGTSSGLLRKDGKKALITNILDMYSKNSLSRIQTMSAGLRKVESGLAKEAVSSEILNRFITGSILLEEFSPFRAGRTLSLSHMLQTVKLSKDMGDYLITGKEINAMGSHYYDKAAESGRRTISQMDINLGLMYRDKKIYGVKMDAKGKAVANLDDIVFNSAIPMLTQTDASGKGASNNINQIARKLLIEEDSATRPFDSYNKRIDVRKVMFSVAETDSSNIRKITTAYVSKMFESGSRALDSPLGMLGEFAENVSPVDPNPPARPRPGALGRIYEAINPRMGTGVISSSGMMSYDRKFSTQLKSFGAKAIAKPILLAAAALTLNQVSGELFGHENDLVNLGADTIANAHLLYARTFSDGFLGDIKKRQEEIMPGSTGVMPILGVTGSLFMLGASSSYFKSLYEKGSLGIAAGENLAAKKPIHIDPIKNMLGNRFGSAGRDFADKALNTIKNFPLGGRYLSSETFSRHSRWGMVGAAIGAVLSLPLIPGAIAGTDSETLKRQYSGEENVAVKSTKGWIMGGGAFEGGKTKYFDKHWYAKLKADTETKTIYGDKETKNALNPILNPFDYLADPYRLEKLKEKEIPFPVWGMDVTYGGFAGEIFEATLGRIIKPTVINPNLAKHMGENEDGSLALKKRVTEDEYTLIQEGKMTAPIAPTIEPTTSALKKAAIGFLDFGGFKGFIGQELINKTGYTSPLLSHSEFEVSGSLTSIAKTIKEANVGDIVGMGEAQRRIINTGADSMAGRKENPLKNLMPSWLPGEDSGYYINFQSGNPYGKIENAATRLPGAGYEEFNKYLKGVDAEKYPLINRYEILADVALGSKEYHSTRRELENKQKRGELNELEIRKLQQVDFQTAERLEKLTFRDDRTKVDVFKEEGVLAGIGRTYWDTLSSIAQGPHDTLSPLRAGSKFIHDRTSTEDYKKNVLYGNDMALWSKPLDHFLIASAQQAQDVIESESVIPESVEKKRAINQYFDRLEFVKQRQLYKIAREEGNIEEQRMRKAKYEGTKIGALTTGLNSKEDIFAANRSMSNQDKGYFSDFGMKTGEKKQLEILGMVSNDDAKIYRALWDNAKISSELTEEERKKFQKDDTAKYEEAMEEAEIESMSFMDETLGIPGVDFSGWDKRIDTNDVKLRFLQLSGEDPREYEFWANDEIEMMRKTAILQDTNFMNKRRSIGNLVDKYRKESELEFEVRSNLQNMNVRADRVEVSDGNGSFEFIK